MLEWDYDQVVSRHHDWSVHTGEKQVCNYLSNRLLIFNCITVSAYTTNAFYRVISWHFVPNISVTAVHLRWLIITPLLYHARLINILCWSRSTMECLMNSKPEHLSAKHFPTFNTFTHHLQTCFLHVYAYRVGSRYLATAGALDSVIILDTVRLTKCLWFVLGRLKTHDR